MSIVLFIIAPIIIIIFLTLIYPTDKVEFKKFSKKEEDQLLSEEIKSLEKLIHKSDTLRNETLNKIKTNNKTKNSKKPINTNNIVQKVLKNGFIVQPVLYFDDENEQYDYLVDNRYSYETHDSDEDDVCAKDYEMQHQSECYNNDIYGSDSSDED